MKKQQNVLLRHHYRVIFFILIHFLLFGTVSFGQVDTLRIATYNLLFFPDSTQSQRAPYFRIVVNAVNADILLVHQLFGRLRLFFS